MVNTKIPYTQGTQGRVRYYANNPSPKCYGTRVTGYSGDRVAREGSLPSMPYF